MCGIYFYIGDGSSEEDYRRFEAKCMCMLKRRGPDKQSLLDLDKVRVYSSVLWLQGEHVVEQPKTTEDYVLMWNGDVFKYDNKQLAPSSSDTEFIFSKLSESRTDNDVINVFQSIQGPWACVFWDKITNILWFGRDFFGRQSLLIHQSKIGLILSSVTPTDETFKFNEVRADGIYKLNLDHPTDKPVLYPWDCLPQDGFDPELTGFSLSCPVRLISDNPDKVDVNPTMDPELVLETLLLNPVVDIIVSELIYQLTEAIRIRIELQPGRCKDCIQFAEKCDHPCVGVLFSGGLDSAVLAFLAATILKLENRSLDLLNVAFGDTESSFQVPDRSTGLQALQEMRENLPGFSFRLVEINIDKTELQRVRKETILDLLNPLNTVLDDSIGSAIWFAAQGSGKVEGKDYLSPCRVLLAGMGIDEQLGGYSRHRSRFLREGLPGLEDELRMELLRISERNLGRDNRIVSDHGVAARFPFLDENVVSYLSSLDTEIKCNLNLPRGIGEKLVLRLAAHKLGLVKTAREPKRAVQFGSRIAKLENKKEKGADLAVRD